MRVGLRLHDREEALARGGIVARRPLQRLDEAGERGERRAQLVACIGDEIGAHLLDPAQRRQIVERHQDELAGADRMPSVIGITIASYQRSTGTRMMNSTRSTLAARAGAADRIEDFRIAQAERERLATPQRRRDGARTRVERHHVAVTIERHHRIGQARQHRLDQRVVGIAGERLGLRRSPRARPKCRPSRSTPRRPPAPSRPGPALARGSRTAKARRTRPRP